MRVASFVDCLVSGNSVGSNGGGLALQQLESSVTLSRVTVVLNQAQNGGGNP